MSWLVDGWTAELMMRRHEREARLRATREEDARRVRLNFNGWAPDDWARKEREAQMRDAKAQMRDARS